MTDESVKGTIRVRDRDGSVHTLAADETMTLMEVLRTNRLSVEAKCGGSAKCATCQVYVPDRWRGLLSAPTEYETRTLSRKGVDVREDSRLSCQIKWTAALDGIELVVAPGRSTTR